MCKHIMGEKRGRTNNKRNSMKCSTSPAFLAKNEIQIVFMLLWPSKKFDSTLASHIIHYELPVLWFHISSFL